MMRAVRFRGEGLSLRQIAEQLRVHHSTVAADLRKWDEEQSKVSELPVGFRTPRGVKSDSESDGSVIPLRRPA